MGDTIHWAFGTSPIIGPANINMARSPEAGVNGMQPVGSTGLLTLLAMFRG